MKELQMWIDGKLEVDFFIDQNDIPIDTNFGTKDNFSSGNTQVNLVTDMGSEYLILFEGDKYVNDSGIKKALEAVAIVIDDPVDLDDSYKFDGDEIDPIYAIYDKYLAFTDIEVQFRHLLVSETSSGQQLLKSINKAGKESVPNFLKSLDYKFCFTFFNNFVDQESIYIVSGNNGYSINVETDEL
jgi:hypothetical protein